LADAEIPPRPADWREEDGDWPATCRIAHLFEQMLENEPAKQELRSLPASVIPVTRKGGKERSRFMDGWGRPTDYRTDLRPDGQPAVISAGPDRRFDTTADNLRSDEAE